MTSIKCLVCSHEASIFGAVDFYNQCNNLNENIGMNNKKIDYYYCYYCHFMFAPEMCNWGAGEFKEKIYNEHYHIVDPHSVSFRANHNQTMIMNNFPHLKSDIKHCDYGAGNGLLSQLLRDSGYVSKAFDPFYGVNEISAGEKFNLITAFEVFEHHPRPHELFTNIFNLCEDECLIFATTLTSDNYLETDGINWQYLLPRNGHVSIYSRLTLSAIARHYNYEFLSVNELSHLFFKTIPNFAKHIIATPN